MKYARGVLVAITTVMLGFVPSAAAATNDFTVVSYHADYYLGADKEGRSTLKTVETIVVDVSRDSQKRQISQTIAKNYDGHPTNLQLISVTDQNKKAVEYQTTSGDDNETVSITVPSGTTGQQAYVITYTQRDVTKYVAKPGEHEFAWQVNDTRWEQVIPQVSATVYADSNVTPTLNKKATCTVGSTACHITETGNTITVSAANVAAGQSMAIMVGFTAGTFRAYQPTLDSRIAAMWPVPFSVTIIILIVTIGLVSYRKKRKGKQ